MPQPIFVVTVLLVSILALVTHAEQPRHSPFYEGSLRPPVGWFKAAEKIAEDAQRTSEKGSQAEHQASGYDWLFLDRYYTESEKLNYLLRERSLLDTLIERQAASREIPKRLSPLMKNRVQHELDDLYDQCLQKAFQQKLSDFPADVRQCEVEYMRTLGGEEMRGHTKETKEAIQKLIDDKYYNCRRALSGTRESCIQKASAKIDGREYVPQTGFVFQLPSPTDILHGSVNTFRKYFSVGSQPERTPIGVLGRPQPRPVLLRRL